MTETMSALVLQVSECIEALNQHLSLLGEITVEGEISRLDVKSGRLIFGTIKDAASSMDIFSLSHIIRNYRQFEPGMLVHVSGTPGLYKGSGKFRLFVNQMSPQGEGALQIAYEKLKAQLESEGLFAPERKRPLPPWPKHIGLITAAGSSAQADLIKILQSRMGNLHIMTLPVNVQGRDAIPSILQAFTYVASHPKQFDLVIMARGGGSLEDLAAFNSEDICRTLFACPVPVISAIGHEDNWSLTDYVADVRASTPSNAAELAVRDHRDVSRQLGLELQAIKNHLLDNISVYHSQIERHRRLLTNRLHTLTREVAENMAKVSVMQQSLKQATSHYIGELSQTLPRLKLHYLTRLSLVSQSVRDLNRLVGSYDYHNVLKRGYSITTLNDKILKSATSLKSGHQVHTQLSTGGFDSIIK